MERFNARSQHHNLILKTVIIPSYNIGNYKEGLNNENKVVFHL